MEKFLGRLINESKVVPFVGAGVSLAVKNKTSGENIFLGWADLLYALANELQGLGKTDEAENVRSSLKVKSDYLSIADDIKTFFPNENFYFEALKKYFDIGRDTVDDNSLELARAIWGLEQNLVITTNYDKVLHWASTSPDDTKYWDIQSNYEQASSLRDGIDKPTVWHLHGHIDNKQNIILTTDSYRKLYNDAINGVFQTALSTLKNYLAQKSFLFIGYSLNDRFFVNELEKVCTLFHNSNSEHYILLKEGDSLPKNLEKKIIPIFYKDHGQPLIEKLRSLKTTSKSTQTCVKHKNTSHNVNNLTTLPAKNAEFVGRKKELEIIERQLKNDSLIYVVNGIGGVGKSELSYQYLHEHSNRYNNIAFIEFTEDNTSLEEMFLIKFRDEFHLDEHATFETIIKRLQHLPKKNLLLLDNLEKKEDFEKIKVLNINFDLLITTRRKDIDINKQLNLETLNNEDAKKLFLDIYDDDTIEDILVYLDNHPLFINLTAKSLKLGYITLNELRDNIQNNTIIKIDSTDDKTFQEHLQGTFNKQFTHGTSNDQKVLLQIFALFPSIEINYTELEQCIGTEKLRVKLSKLVERGWLTKKEDNYKLHQIIKTFIMSDHPIAYDKITFVLDNISTFIDPNDPTLIITHLSHYISIIESLLIHFETEADNHIASILDSITYLYFGLAQYQKALSYQNKSFKMRKELFGKEHEYTALSMNLLAVIYKRLGAYDKALPLYKKALEIRQNVFGQLHSSTAQSHNNLAVLFQDMGDNTKALELYKKAVKTNEEVLGNNHPVTATGYSNLAILLHGIGEDKEALLLLEKALQIREAMLGEKHHVTAQSYNELAVFFQDMKENTKALQLYEKALSIREEVLGDSHPDTAHSYNNLAVFYESVKKYKMALPLLEKALSIREKVLGDSHPDTAHSYSNLAMFYFNLKECEKAKTLIMTAIKSLKQLNYVHPELHKFEQILKKFESNIKKQKKAGFRQKGRYCL